MGSSVTAARERYGDGLVSPRGRIAVFCGRYILSITQLGLSFLDDLQYGSAVGGEVGALFISNS